MGGLCLILVSGIFIVVSNYSFSFFERDIIKLHTQSCGHMWHQLSKQPSTRDLTSTTITQLLRNMRELYAPTQSRLPSKAYVHVLLVCVSPLKGRCGLSYV